MFKINVLFVDDEPSILEALRRSIFCNKLPWDAQYTTSGREALGLLKNHDFDVIVSDLNMPGMSGRELLEQVSREYPNIVQVILSGTGEEELSTDQMVVGPQYLRKPCTSEQLVSVIQRSISLKEFSQSGILNNLIESFKEFSCFPEIRITNCSVDHFDSDRQETMTQITCPELGILLRVPQQRSSEVIEPVSMGVDR